MHLLRWVPPCAGRRMAPSSSRSLPISVLYYNSNMAGVDLNDQFRTWHPVGRRSCYFLYLFDVSLLNSYLLYKSMPQPLDSKPMDHFQFHLSIAKTLCQGGGARRQAPEAGPSAVRMAASNQEKHRRVTLSSRKKQCFQCHTKDVKTDSGRHPETVFRFVLCNTHICNELFCRFSFKLHA